MNAPHDAPKGAPKGPGSFCVPRAAVEALLDAKATAYEICAYLVLAKYTDESGRYSPASISAMNKATGANKVKGGPVDRAIERLKQIRAKTVKQVSNGRSGKSHAMVDQVADLGPILFELVQAIRAANKKPALVPPWEANKPQAGAAVDKVPT